MMRAIENVSMRFVAKTRWPGPGLVVILHFAFFAGAVLADEKPGTGGETKAGEVREFEIAEGVRMKFCWIPPGEAQLGSPKAEQDYIIKRFYDGNRKDWMDAESENARGK